MLIPQNLCVMYLHGNGMPVDKEKAAAWCRKAADGGSKDAQRALKQPAFGLQQSQGH